MKSQSKKIGLRMIAGAVLVAGPAAGCGPGGPSYEQWAETDGAAGRINLDAVQEAFKHAKSPSQFEQRINEIYEGDGLVLVRAKQESDGLVLEGWEDLNNNNKIDEDSDDQLFGIFERSEQHELRGYGANSYYNRGFGAGDFLFSYMLLSAINPRGYYYTTPYSYARSNLTSYRNNYRRTTAYRNTVTSNSKYFNQQKNFSSSKYSSSGKNLSPGRQKYLTGQRASGSYKNSRTGVRSSWGNTASRSRYGGSSGGFRGGGSSQRIIGDHRAFI